MIINKDFILNQVYPIGSIYMSVNSINPGTIFGGTWTQITNRFLIGASSTYPINSTGGNTSVKLDFNNYRYNIWSAEAGAANNDINGFWNPFGTGNSYGIGLKYTSNNNTSFSIMPPYLSVYMWKRIS